ncbi:hypothetical protein KXV58_004861 [Aspergillus fumigatus]|nr:hypothetical protein KXV58_004861 [Aspergillus fumigatus]
MGLVCRVFAVGPNQKTPDYGQDRSVSPVIPLSMALAPTHGPVSKGDRTGRDQRPTQGLASAEKTRRVIDKATAAGSNGGFKLEEGQGMFGTQDGVDTKTDGDESHDGGEERHGR